MGGRERGRERKGRSNTINNSNSTKNDNIYSKIFYLPVRCVWHSQQVIISRCPLIKVGNTVILTIVIIIIFVTHDFFVTLNIPVIYVVFVDFVITVITVITGNIVIFAIFVIFEFNIFAEIRIYGDFDSVVAVSHGAQQRYVLSVPDCNGGGKMMVEK